MRFGKMILVALMLMAVLGRGARAEMQGPYVFKSSVRINTRKFLRYWPTPGAKEPQYSTNCWAPRFEFNVLGPLEGGSQISVAFTKTDGSAWFSTNLPTPEKMGEEFAHFSSDALDLEKKAIITTGNCGMTITLSNALNKTNKVLYTGKFEVGKFYYGPQAAAKHKDSCDYFVNHDWNLPIGQMVFDPLNNEEAPHLRIHMWFRGPFDQETMAGYLYYKGKQIASTKSGGGVYEHISIETGSTQPDTRWGRVTISFDKVSNKLKQTSASNFDSMYFLDKFPGEYEVKVLRDGKLARTATFTIGDDGNLVDNGLAEKNKMGFGVILIPVKVEPGMDVKADVSHYKEQAYYGNPVVGFP